MAFKLEEDGLLSRVLRANQIAQQFEDLLDPAKFFEMKARDAVLGEDANELLFNSSTREIESGINFGKNDDQGSFIEKAFKFGEKAVGFLVNLVKAITFSASQAWGWIRGAWNFLVNFDWNASDATLKEQMRQANLTLAAVWGGFVGEVFGTAAAIGVGYLITVGIGAGLNLLLPGLGSLLTPSLARAVALDTLKERLPELFDSLKFALYQTAAIFLKNLATSSYIAIRKALKALFPEQLKNWGNGERWTIAEAFENWIENVTGIEWINVAAEEAAEEFDEAFWETGFVYAHNLDEAIAQAKLTKEEILGQEIPQVTIELDPDTNEKLLLPNQPSTLAQQQVLTEISQFRRIRNRDIGYFTGEKLVEESRRFNFLRTGKVIFRDKEIPPFGSGKLTTITLKDLKQGLKWRDFKLALRPYTWGEYYVYATLNRSRQEIGGYFSSIQEGENYLKNLIELLIDDSYIAIDSRIEVERNLYVKKNTEHTIVYPAFITITVKTPVTDREDATHDLAGNSYERDLNKIPLWTTREPPIDGLNNTEFLT